MKIAIIGYGKMGKAIEAIAVDRGHQIVFKTNDPNFSKEEVSLADVAIEFTTPDSAVGNIKTCADAGVPVVVGTTAWYDSFDETAQYIRDNKGGLFTATNFSIGVNLFFKLNALAAQLIDGYSEYEPSIDEIHHLQKLDAPSGTAITTAETLLTNLSRKNNWVHHENGIGTISNDVELSVNSFREENVPGTHTVKYSSDIDTIEIKHTAHNRKGFATGAVVAAEWMVGKTGIYTMRDLLNL
ncbi:MAG: 4-hydroxy-tetrahydrodipicolinate reductase [Bacteroidia bacterium]|nr:4-hydroxy-tetrahydrodipicolinate reductase [Bacteroidia bacterium]